MHPHPTPGAHRPLVVAEVPLDDKYGEIVARLPVEYRYMQYRRLLGWLATLGPLRSRPRVYLHLRYLKWRGRWRTLPIYLLMLGLARLQGVRIVWTCHNVWEHRFPARWQNRVLREWVARLAHRIVVLHPSIAHHLPPGVRSRVVHATYGSMRGIVERNAAQRPPAPGFLERYGAWLRARGIEAPDVVMVSATLTDAPDLFEWVRRRSDLHVLAIAPRVAARTADERILHVRTPVYRELDELLRAEGLVGYLAHTNHSVPTGIYLFASYGIPVLAPDVSPLREILREFGMGETYRTLEELSEAFDRIREDYPRYRRNCRRFLERHTWEAGAAAHAEVFV